jgi:hypothetical protein
VSDTTQSSLISDLRPTTLRVTVLPALISDPSPMMQLWISASTIFEGGRKRDIV